MKIRKILFIIIFFVCLFFVLLSIVRRKNSTPTSPATSLPSFQPPKTIKTNQWFSTVYKKFPSDPLFAFPLAYKLEKEGLGISYPQIHASPNTVFATYIPDMTVGVENIQFSKNRIDSAGDWNVNLSLSSLIDPTTMSMSLAQGLPYTAVYLNNPKEIHLTFRETAQVIKTVSTEDSNGVILSLNHTYYLLLYPKDSLLKQSGKLFSIQNTKRLFVALLSDPEKANIFFPLSQIHIYDTQANYKVEKNILLTTFTIDSSENNRFITSLFPHQLDTLSQKNQKTENLGTYSTLRGPMKLITGNSFTTQIPLIIPPFTFAEFRNTYRDSFIKTLQTEIKTVANEPVPESKDYFLGKWLGKLTTLYQLANTFQLSEEAKLLKAKIQNTLDSLDSYFTYDKNIQSFVATDPEFGNEKGNDHHFHYGYFIRAAAVIGKDDPDSLKKWKPVISEMVGDITTLSRDSERYPYIRTFNPYESHSYADGFGVFGDGNDQESSSEAINAWYGVYLWAQTTQDVKLEQASLALYNSEILGTNYYWFNAANIYPPQYQHAIASIVWGGKVDFATWFSNETNMIYGIQLLPLTPASIYLKNINFEGKYKDDYIRSGGSMGKSWADLFVAWQSFHNKTQALTSLKQITHFDGSELKSLVSYFVYSQF